MCSKIVPGSYGELVICGIYKSNNKMGKNGKETAYDNDLYEYKSNTHPYYFYSKYCSLNHYKRGSASSYGDPMYKELSINSRTLNFDSAISYSTYFENDNIIITKEGKKEIDLEHNHFFAEKNEIYLSLELYNSIFTEEKIPDWNLSSNVLHHLEESIELNFCLKKSINNRIFTYKEDKLPKFVIKGVYQGFEKSFIASEEIVDTLNYYFNSNEIIVKTSTILNLENTLKELSKQDIYSHYTMTNKMNGYLDLILLLKLIGGIVTGFSLILIVIQAYTYISSCVQSRAKTIGVFKSLGIPKNDVFKIFLLQFSIVSLLKFSLLTPITFGFVILFNYLLVKDYHACLNVIVFKPIYILYIFLIVFILSMVLSVIVSLIKISKSIHKLLY